MKLLGLAAAVLANPWIENNYWSKARSVRDFAIANPTVFYGLINSHGASAYRPLYDYCRGDDAFVDGDELIICAGKMADHFMMSKEDQHYLLGTGRRYWNDIDWNGSGKLDFMQFKILFGGAAATHALLIEDVYDRDGDNILSGSELTAWKNQEIDTGSSWGWDLRSDRWGSINGAASNAQLDDEPNDFSLLEIARFELFVLVVYIEE